MTEKIIPIVITDIRDFFKPERFPDLGTCCYCKKKIDRVDGTCPCQGMMY